MPIPATRLASSVGALSATVLIAGASAGVATAGPGPDSASGSDNGGGTSQTEHQGILKRTIGVAVQDTRALTQPIRRAFGLPKAVLGGLRDREGSSGTTKQADPSVDTESVGPDQYADPDSTPRSARGSSARIELPSGRTITVPVLTLPGTPATAYSINLSGPVTALSTTTETYETTNALVTDAVRPYSPFGPYGQPKPQPQPQLKVFEAEPAVIDVSGGGGGGGGGALMSVGLPDLHVLETPLLVPAAIRLAPPRPVAEAVPPATTTAQAASAPSAGAPAPASRVPVSQAGVQAAESPASTSAASSGNVALRQGFPQNLRDARMAQVASVALPGVAGLLAITVAGGAIGYRQANSGRYVRADAARFLT